MSPTRSVLVEAARMDGWLVRFGERNGPYAVDADGGTPGGSVRIVATNGCSALLSPPLPVETPAPVDGPLAPALLAGLDRSAVVGLLLIRRGGYSVGTSRAGRILSSKTGTRYVQGRTAAGGWSQQRFARRRANQADALVEETARRAAALFDAEQPVCLQLGGDRTLAGAALAEPILARHSKLPQVPFLTVPDPRFTILQEAARSALSFRITVTDPP
jgi:hypothetical protein